LLKPQSLIAGYELFNSDEKIDFVMGVSQYEYPPVQALKSDQNGFLSYMWPEWKNIQSQFHPELYVSNGTFYWARRDALIRGQTFYGEKMRGCIVPKEQVSDINSIEDLPEVLRKLDIGTC
jgi:CMP-N-acetylneuraminic acid synthetase